MTQLSLVSMYGCNQQPLIGLWVGCGPWSYNFEFFPFYPSLFQFRPDARLHVGFRFYFKTDYIDVPWGKKFSRLLYWEEIVERLPSKWNTTQHRVSQWPKPEKSHCSSLLSFIFRLNWEILWQLLCSSQFYLPLSWFKHSHSHTRNWSKNGAGMSTEDKYGFCIVRNFSEKSTNIYSLLLICLYSIMFEINKLPASIGSFGNYTTISKGLGAKLCLIY